MRNRGIELSEKSHGNIRIYEEEDQELVKQARKVKWNLQIFN